MTRQARIAFADGDSMVETLWVEQVGPDHYRLQNTPFFYYGVSLEDVVQARWRPEDLEEQEEGEQEYGFPYFEKVVAKSGNRTLRLGLIRAGVDDFQPLFRLTDPAARSILDQISQLGCGFEGFPPYLVAINVPATVSLDHVMAYLDSTGLKWENGDPPSEDVPGRVCYPFTLDNKGEDQYGGSPPGVTGDRWPICEQCNVAMTFILSLERHPQRLRLSHRAVGLFLCRQDLTGSVLLLDDTPCADALPHPGLPRRWLSYRREEEPNPWGAGTHQLGPAQVSKVGGYPRWRSRELTPFCHQCGQPMALLAQLDGGLDADLGLMQRVGYLFLCPQEHEGRFVVDPALGAEGGFRLSRM